VGLYPTYRDAKHYYRNCKFTQYSITVQNCHCEFNRCIFDQTELQNNSEAQVSVEQCNFTGGEIDIRNGNKSSDTKSTVFKNTIVSDSQLKVRKGNNYFAKCDLSGANMTTTTRQISTADNCTFENNNND
jgi:uncharacterized protein YjbI with pentapeptide repeats